MSDVERLGSTIVGWFVRPGGGQVEARTAGSSAPIDEPVLLAAGESTALGVAAAVALSLARDGIAVLACWQVAGVERRRGGLAVGRVRRLAASLEARDVAATAAGRLIVVSLPADAREAIVALRRVESACGTAVCVPVIGAARGAEWDEILAERGAAVLYGQRSAVMELAVAQLAEQGVVARTLAPVPGPVVRALAVGGWTSLGGRALRTMASGG